MPRYARPEREVVPHLPDLLVRMAGCWLAIRDAQTEVDPFGDHYEALEEARVGIEALAHRLTGQAGFLALRDDHAARASHPAEVDAAPF